MRKNPSVSLRLQPCIFFQPADQTKHLYPSIAGWSFFNSAVMLYGWALIQAISLVFQWYGVEMLNCFPLEMKE